MESITKALEIEKRREIDWISAVTCNTDALPEESSFSEPIQPLAVDNIRSAQNADPGISRVLVLKRTHAHLWHKHNLGETEVVRQLLKEWPRLQIDGDGILRRETVSRNRLVVPESLKPLIHKHLHEEMGHLGADRMVALARERFFWPKMREEIEHYVTRVCCCVKRKKPN